MDRNITCPWPSVAGMFVVSNTVSVHDLPISADIGVHSHEFGRPQRLLVTAIINVEPPTEDNIGEALDYNHVVALAERLGQTRIALIEIFAMRLAAALLSHSRALEVDVSVIKPGALLAGVASTRIVARRG